MPDEAPYTKREIDTLTYSLNKRFDDQDHVLDEIVTQTKKTNGRVTKLEQRLYIIAAVVGTILILKFPELVSLIKLII